MSRTASASSRSMTYRLTSLLLAGALAMGGLVATGLPAHAAGAKVVSGVISVDSNANGVRDTSTVAGQKDAPLGGVAVSLVCVADNTVLATTLTSAAGAYEFGTGDLGACVGDVKVRLSTNDAADIYATEAISADNLFARTSPQAAETATFTPAAASPVVFDGLVKPTWKSNLAIAPDDEGWGGKAVKTGSPVFDADEAEPGRDTSAANDLVRAGDTVTYTFSATFASDDPLADSVTSAVLEQTITLTPGAVANFARIPTICTGTSPASSIKAMPSGTVIAGSAVPPAGTTSVVLTCNFGAIGDARQALLPSTSIWVSATSTNGSSFSTSSRLYGVDAAGATSIQPSASIENGPIQITSQPRFDLRKGYYTTSGLTTASINGSTMPGYYVYYHIGITTDRKVGVEAFKQPITVSEDFFGQFASTSAAGTMGDTVTGLKWYLTQCIPSPQGSTAGTWTAGTWVVGKKTALNADYAASNSGTCTPVRDTAGDTAPYTLTLNGIDTSGVHYPKQTVSGAPLSAGPYWIASYRLQIFVPMTEIDRAAGAPNDGAGTLSVSNLTGNFDPDGVSGASNFGSGLEPGYCADGTPTASGSPLQLDCALMEDGTRSNNVAGPTTLQINPGSWAKYNFDFPTGWVQSEQLLPGSGASHDGAATLQPGQTGGSDIRIGNGGANPMTGIMMCDVFDNTTMKLTTLDKVVNSNPSGFPLNDRYAYVLQNVDNTAATNLAYQANWKIQYAHVDLTGDNPISGGLNAAYNRYDGTWTAQRNAGCGDADAAWQDTVDAAGGIDQVNAVRAVAINGYGLPTAAFAFLKVAYEQRDTFNGGPNAGAKIPSGTVAANFARVRSDSYAPTWTGRNYIPMSPAGESGHSDGDRWTVTRAEMSLKKRTITVGGVGTGAADVGNTGTAIAGNKVVWEVISSLTAASLTPAPVNNVVITDTLPKYSVYNEACTAGLAGGTPASSYTLNANGTTTLVWNLGTRTPNQPIPSRIICTDTDPLAPTGTSLVNWAVITSPDVTPVSAHKDDHTVVLEQTGELRLRKDVDQTLDLEDQDQAYTLRVKNSSDTLAVKKPTVIDVLSDNSDATSAAGVNRNPASDFVGSNGLTGPVLAFDWSGTVPVAGTVYYTTVAPASIPQDLNADTDPTIWTPTVADYSTVTGFKFVAAVNLGIAGSGNASGLVLKYTTKQADNDPGDLYSNRFTAFSDTFMNGAKFQLMTSNQTTVRVVGFSLGDLIWTDENYDGKFTAGVDTPAPEGVKVQVFRDGDPTPVATVTTNADGRWVVNDLSTGDYYAVIPASEFATGGLLAMRVASTTNVIPDPNSDLNEVADHHALAYNGGVRSSGLTHLSAVVAGSVITGQEPAGDNTGGVRLSPGTTDDFTNLTVDLALVRVPAYTFAKAAVPASGAAVRVGDTITYSLTGSNTGATTLDPVTITDDLTGVVDWATVAPSSLKATIGATTVTAPSVSADGKTLSWTGQLKAGETVTVTYQVTVNAGADGQTLHNSATSSATPPNGADPITGEGSTSHPVGGFSLTKASDPASGQAVAASGVITYTVVGTNTGGTSLDPVSISDDLAAVLDHATLVGPPTASVAGNPVAAPSVDAANKLTWVGSLAKGEAVTITYQVKANADAAGSTLVNKASGEATPTGGEPIKTGEVSTSHPVPGFTFVKKANPADGSLRLPGQSITYTLTGTNTGATVLDPVTINDDLTEVVAHATLAPASLSASLGAAPTLAADGKSIAWTGSLAVGQTVEITYQVTLNDDATGAVLRNAATASATPPDGLQPITHSGTTSHPVPGFDVAKTSAPGSGKAVLPGDVITYTVVGTNIGATSLTPVQITDDASKVLNHATLVAGSLTATVNGVAAAAPTLDASTGLITWSGDLAKGEAVTITYQVKADADSSGAQLENAVVGTATPPGGEPLTVPEVKTVHPVAGFTFAKASNPVSGELRQPGQSIIYTLTGSNTGATVLDPVVITDDLSKVLNHATLDASSLKATIGGAEVTAPTLDAATNTLNWTGTLAVGEVVTVTYEVTVNEGVQGVVLKNSASASATPPDGLPPITPPIVATEHPTPGFSLSKSAAPASTSAVEPGETVTYTLVGSNFGQTLLDPVVVTDDLSGVLAYADLDPASLSAKIDGVDAAAPTVVDGTLTWTGALKAGEVVTITYAVTVKEGVMSATSVLRNKASGSATPPGGTPIVTPDEVTEHPITGFTLVKEAIAAHPDGLAEGDTVTYSVRGTNIGAATLDPVTITDDLSQVLPAATLQGTPTATVIHADGTTTASTASVSGTVLTWTGPLAPGDQVEITYTFVVKKVTKPAVLHNAATAVWSAPSRPATPVSEVVTDNPVKPAEQLLPQTGSADVAPVAAFSLLAVVVGGAMLRRRRHETI